MLIDTGSQAQKQFKRIGLKLDIWILDINNVTNVNQQYKDKQTPIL